MAHASVCHRPKCYRAFMCVSFIEHSCVCHSSFIEQKCQAAFMCVIDSAKSKVSSSIHACVIHPSQSTVSCSMQVVCSSFIEHSILHRAQCLAAFTCVIGPSQSTVSCSMQVCVIPTAFMRHSPLIEQQCHAAFMCVLHTAFMGVIDPA